MSEAIVMECLRCVKPKPNELGFVDVHCYRVAYLVQMKALHEWAVKVIVAAVFSGYCSVNVSKRVS